MQLVEKFKLEAPNVIPDGFVTLEEACEILGKGHATVERYVATKKLEQRIVRVSGRRTFRAFPRAALIALRDEEQRKKEARPPSQLVPRPAFALTGAGGFLERIAAALVALVPILERKVEHEIEHAAKPSPVRLPEKYWLSLGEAAELSGLAKSDLRRLAGEGKLVTRRSGGLKFRRESLEGFEG
jgi:hypothetical protein